jgi:MFS family permease
MRPHAPALAIPLLREANFRSLWGVGGLTEISRRLELLALSWLILETTNSTFQLALIWVFNNLPRPILSPFTGIIADRFSRHRVMVVAQGLNGLTATGVLFLLVADVVQPWHVFAATFLQGATRALEDPSRRTAIFDVVGEGRLVNAMALETISNTVGKMIGPILGGVLVGTVGFTWAYVGAVLVHLLALALLTRVKIPVYRGPADGDTVWQSLREGVKYAWSSPVLRGLLYVTVVMNALAFPMEQFIPAVGRDHLGVGPALTGLLLASEGFGRLAAAGIMAVGPGSRYHGRVFVVGSLVVLVLTVLFAWSPWYGLSFALLTVSGIGQAGFGTMQSSIVLLTSPPQMRGRMMGLLSVFIGIGNPLGALEIGVLATAFGTQWAISASALAGLLLMLPAVVLTPLVWRPSIQPPPAMAKR